MDSIFFLVGAGLAGWLCHYMASNRNRNAVGWAITGFCFGLIPAIILLCLGKLEPDLSLEQVEDLLNRETMK